MSVTNLGQELMADCTHQPDQLKKVSEMQVCNNGKLYLQELVDTDELPVLGCEQCTIEWLCGDAIEHCLNTEDDAQWWTQCVRNRQHWIECLTPVWNRLPDHVLYFGFYSRELFKSMVGIMQMHDIKFTLE